MAGHAPKGVTLSRWITKGASTQILFLGVSSHHSGTTSFFLPLLLCVNKKSNNIAVYPEDSVIQNVVKDPANVSCKVPARDPSLGLRMTHRGGMHYWTTANGLIKNGNNIAVYPPLDSPPK